MAELAGLLSTLDYGAVAVFGASGALAAARRKHDIVTFGFFAAVTGVGGGTLRDLLLGAPVFWVAKPAYLGVCLAATKWGLEGWSESLAYELEPFGIRVKTVAPGGISTDFAGRSLVFTPHEAYMGAIGKVMAAFTNPERRANASTAEQIAQVVYEAATDETDKVSFVAGQDAIATYAHRLSAGIDAFRGGIKQMFLG